MSEAEDSRAAQWAEARRWFEFVENDLRTAEACLAAKPILLGSAAYHCQQAAEKVIKGLLVAASRPFPKIHDIKDLADRAAPDYPSLVERMDALREVTPWGFAYRYPPEEEKTEEAPTEESVRSVIGDIRSLFAAARALDPYST